MNVSEQDSGNPQVWVPLGESVAAGFALTGSTAELVALVIYAPDSAALRSIRLQDADPLRWLLHDHRIRQQQPPDAAQVADAWRAGAHLVAALDDWLRGLDEAGRAAYESSLLVRRWVAFQLSTGKPIPTGRDLERVATIGPGIAAEDVAPRRAGESADDFYRRISSAYLVLKDHTQSPAAELARIAGVPSGTVASWIHRARQRGWLDEPQQQKGER